MPAAEAIPSQRAGPASLRRRLRKSMIGSMGTDHIPKFGIDQFPSLGCGIGHTVSVETRPRDILRANLKALMSTHQELDTIVKVSERSGVSKGVVERMTKAEANTGVDHLQGIAQAFGLEVWQLMVPNLEPTNAPVLQEVSERQKEMWKRIHDAAQELTQLGKGGAK